MSDCIALKELAILVNRNQQMKVSGFLVLGSYASLILNRLFSTGGKSSLRSGLIRNLGVEEVAHEV